MTYSVLIGMLNLDQLPFNRRVYGYWKCVLRAFFQHT